MISFRYIIAALAINAAAIAVATTSGFPYQAALRNADGTPKADQTLSVRFSILQGGTDGQTVYTEDQFVTTDARGAFDAMVGEGTATTTSFADIDWTASPYFMKVELASSDGAYSLLSTQELLSTPFAANADIAEALEGIDWNGRLYRLVVDDYGVVEPILMPKGYTRLVWHDSFNGTGLPDPDKWTFEEGKHINSELQYYVGPREQNCFMSDGVLHLRCINNDKIYNADGECINGRVSPYDGSMLYITAPSICTKNKGDWRYCYLEARIKVPAAKKGVWPAVWMMPTNNEYGYWPRSGEIDIMEYVGNEPSKYNCALHHLYGDKGGSKSMVDIDDWHTIALDWRPEKMEWLIDGKVFCRVSNPNTNWGDWPYDKEFYLILNFAYGGGWGGREGIDLTQLPLDFLVDYVRVFQK